jgi:hypothetical protein
MGQRLPHRLMEGSFETGLPSFVPTSEMGSEGTAMTFPAIRETQLALANVPFCLYVSQQYWG